MDRRAIIHIAALSLLACQAPAPDRETLHSQLPERPYSGVVRVGNTYYFSGKVGVTDATRALTGARTAAEVQNIMEAFAELFSELGLEFNDVVQGNVFLVDVDDYAEMNRVYGEYFVSDPPARTTVAVSALPGGANVEISFVAVRTTRQR
ncbi:MAG: RidA family protein [Gemmatimonadota bacterium]|nr:MAG: RidA family protein [Gemmatimonadota bacterium]